MVVVVAATACAAGDNTAAGGPGAAGFWLGLRHGLLSPITFVVSLVAAGVGVDEIDNTGVGYDLGFLLGVSAVFSRAAAAPAEIDGRCRGTLGPVTGRCARGS